MAAFNSTLFGDLQNSGLFDMKPKSLFPLNNPQRPEDLKQEDNKQAWRCRIGPARRLWRLTLRSDTRAW